MFSTFCDDAVCVLFNSGNGTNSTDNKIKTVNFPFNFAHEWEKDDALASNENPITFQDTQRK